MSRCLQEKACQELHDRDSLPLSRIFYYVVKPLIPDCFRLLLRRTLVLAQQKKYADVWPIFEPAAARPVQWAGWPGGKRFALVLTHDVDTGAGNKKVPALMELDRSLGFTATFFLFPEEYEHPDKHHDLLRRNGFEIAIHGLKHDGKLYQSEKAFNKSAVQINHFIEKWKAAGFRAPCMHHNLAWNHRLNIRYDASTYDTDPFEPQGGGVATIFPFTVTDHATGHSYVELPYTLPQDYFLFEIMRQKTINIWKRKLDWIADNGGMAHLLTHPDYMCFNDNGNRAGKYPALFYEEFLRYIKDRYEGQYWLASAQEMAAYWKSTQPQEGKVSKESRGQ